MSVPKVATAHAATKEKENGRKTSGNLLKIATNISVNPLRSAANVPAVDVDL